MQTLKKILKRKKQSQNKTIQRYQAFHKSKTLNKINQIMYSTTPEGLINLYNNK